MNQSSHLISFAEDLAVLLNAGSDLDASLGLLINTKSHAINKSVLLDIRAKIRQGLRLSMVLDEHSQIFDSYFVGMVRSGEASGQLAMALEQLANQLEANQELRNQVNNALIYPTILALAMAVSLMLVFAVVLPKLTGLFDSFGGELSLSAQLLFAVGRFMNSWGQVILITMAGLILVAYLLYDELRVKQRLGSMLMRVPSLGRLLNQIEFARFTSTLASLLASGLSQTDALAIAAESFRQQRNRQQIDTAIKKVKQGQPLSRAIETISGFGDLYAHSIESGERAGQLPQVLNVLAQRLEKDFARRASRLASMVEPILILVLGVVIGSIIFTVFSALQGVGDLPL